VGVDHAFAVADARSASARTATSETWPLSR
jgi:hypothetical protein